MLQFLERFRSMEFELKIIHELQLIIVHQNRTGTINIFKLYCHRYVRLTAMLAFIVLMSVTLYRRVGVISLYLIHLNLKMRMNCGDLQLAVGPMWRVFIEHGINCEAHWWKSLLYVQNYVNPDAICLAHTWYLSVDMQLYLVAPLLAYLLYRLGNPFMLVVVALMAVSIGWTYYLYVHFNLMFQLTNIQYETDTVIFSN